jgi:peptidoglycan/xylan/chitin deacetylase (PgdA/CDA1 family)
MGSSRRLLRSFAFSTARLTTRFGGTKSSTCILMYHGHQPGVPWAVDPAEFEDQMGYVKDSCRTVLLGTLRDLLADGIDRFTCLTFDDGLADNYEVSLAVLERLGLKGTFFLIPGLIGRALPTRFGSQPLLNSAQIKEIAALGHEIGAHTMTHPNLSACSLDDAEREIVSSKQTLEDLVGREITSFAYPYGSCTPKVKDLVRDAGFQLAVGTSEGHLTPDSDWLELPRVALFRAVASDLFRMKLSPSWPAYLRLKRAGDAVRPMR